MWVDCEYNKYGYDYNKRECLGANSSRGQFMININNKKQKPPQGK